MAVTRRERERKNTEPIDPIRWPFMLNRNEQSEREVATHRERERGGGGEAHKQYACPTANHLTDFSKALCLFTAHG